MKSLKLALLGAALSWMALPAQAITIGFDCITNNNGTNCATGEAQLSASVAAYGVNQVLFTFANSGPAASSITDIYFEDRSPRALNAIVGLIDADQNGGNAGVDFSVGASPGNLPGANNADPDFQVTTGLAADSDSPTQHNGVNPGETLGIIFSLMSGSTIADVTQQIASGGVRIGIHVQGFANGGSESFINTGRNNVPEPATALLLGSGLAGLATLRRKRAKSA